MIDTVCIAYVSLAICREGKDLVVSSTQSCASSMQTTNEIHVAHMHKYSQIPYATKAFTAPSVLLSCDIGAMLHAVSSRYLPLLPRRAKCELVSRKLLVQALREEFRS